MDSGRSTRALPRVSFLIRRSRDQRSVSTSPGLIAAAHVLHRLLAPRHPPCALILLIRKEHVLSLWSFQGARELEPPALQGAASPSLTHAPEGTPRARDRPIPQSSTACLVPDQAHERRGRRFSRRVVRPGRPSSRARASTDITASGVLGSGFPRKEVIQPHLPVRLPCYDFTPIIDPTFDGCLLLRG